MKEKHPIVKAIAKIIFYIGRAVLSLRYRVTLKGVKNIDPNKPVLFLPNHQAVVDPMILVSYLYPHKNVVPVVTSSYYDLPVLKLFFKNWGAVRVSDLVKGSRNVNVLKDITDSAINAFKHNRSIVIYPSGQLTGQGYEKILNKKGAFEIVNHLPDDVQVVGVRISGLWGSMWSKAWNGQSPDFVSKLLKGLFYMIANVFIFIPRRKVSIWFEDLSGQCRLKAKENKAVFNRFLEDYYNVEGEQDPVYVKHYFYGAKPKRELPKNIKGSIKYMAIEKEQERPLSFPVVITKGVRSIVGNHLQVNTDEAFAYTHLVNDLGADSIKLVEIIKDIERKFHVEISGEISDINTLGDLYLLASGLSQKTKPLPQCSFKKCYPFNNFIKVDRVDSIPAQFVRRFTSNNHLSFCYDAMLGETTRKEFFLKTCVVAELIKKKCKKKHVGIMLPALQSSGMLIMATYLAGKVPVMLNWTVGKKILEHCVNEVAVDTIFTASSFVEKIKEQLPDAIYNKLVFLDKEVPKINLFTKIKGFFKSKYPKRFYHFSDVDETAVILFTSGSESMPKVVPLSHKNIIQDLKGTLELVYLDRNSILLGYLPPFHSFGFSVLFILPALTGVRVAYSPDPTDGKALVRLLKHTSSSLVVTAPSFLKILLNNAVKDDLTSLKYVVSGAEALSTEVLKYLNHMAPQATLLEGYGITECAPVLSLNPLRHQKVGSVGKIIKGVSCRITDLGTGKILSANQEGMIHFRGDNIFKGYPDHNIPSPFVTIENKQYYKTGDLGYIDQDGFLFITGRLKRFIKIAGEMISLPFIESILNDRYGDDEEISLAVEGSDQLTPPCLVLFTTKPITLTEVNNLLKEKDAPAIAKISRIDLMEKIPLLGTGKIDYKLLRERVEK
jgi:long-chain-fatty-acid--[acyl-carrier-protein] ligase